MIKSKPGALIFSDSAQKLDNSGDEARIRMFDSGKRKRDDVSATASKKQEGSTSHESQVDGTMFTDKDDRPIDWVLSEMGQKNLQIC